MSRVVVVVPAVSLSTIEERWGGRCFVAVDELRLWLAECEIANTDVVGARLLARLLRQKLA